MLKSKILTVDCDSDSGDTVDLTECVFNVTSVGSDRVGKYHIDVFAEMLLGEKKVKFQIDTRMLCESYVFEVCQRC